MTAHYLSEGGPPILVHYSDFITLLGASYVIETETFNIIKHMIISVNYKHALFDPKYIEYKLCCLLFFLVIAFDIEILDDYVFLFHNHQFLLHFD